MNLRAALTAAAAAQALVGCSGDAVPTYHRDVQPLLAEQCGSCHQEGGVAPFSVFEYSEVQRRASRIQRATAERRMPPWLPARGVAEYLNDPTLTDEDIDLIARWVAAGAPEGRRPWLSRGDGAETWELGEPDLVLSMSDGYVLLPSSSDEYRVFVAPVPITSTKYVRAVDFRPTIRASDPQTAPPDSGGATRSSTGMPVHHVVMLLDRTRSSRRLDADDPLAGYEGAFPTSEARPPDGFFLGWTPGRRPAALPEGLAWRLDPGTDLVIQTHLQPSSQALEINATIGLYFADRRPGRPPSSILLSSISIDIPPGDSAYVVEDSYELPVDVDVLSVYPHAHFLAQEMELFARLPDGGRRWLLRIDDWDFNWQDSYDLREAVHLPAGSLLSFRYTYDNSSANPQNPHDPPRRTTFGQRSTDEMAELTLQVLTSDPSDREELERATLEHIAGTLIQGARFDVDSEPGSPRAWFNLGVILRRSGRLDEATSAFNSALTLGMDTDPDLHVELGNLLVESGSYPDAIAHLRRAVELDPRDAQGHFGLGRALEASGANTDAEQHFLVATELLPAHAGAQAGLGRVLRASGRFAAAEARFREAIEISPDLVSAQMDLANLLVGSGRAAEAIDHYEAVVDLAPGLAAGHLNLASTYQLQGRLEQAAEHYRRAVELEPENADAHLGLGNLLRATTASREAVEHLRAAVRLQPGAPEPMLALAWALATEPDPEVRDPETALALAVGAVGLMSPPDARALATLAAALAASGDFSAALARGQEALDLARLTGDAGLAQSVEAHMRLYRQQRAYVIPR